MVLVHKPGLDRARLRPPARARRSRSRALPPFIELHERIAGLVAPSKVVGVALNTSLYPSDDEARAVIAAIAAETGLPADDPVRFGADRLWPAVRERRRGACRGSDASSHEVLRSPSATRSGSPAPTTTPGTRITTVIVELRDDRYPGVVGLGRGLSGPVLRRDARDDGRGPAAPARRRSSEPSSRPPTGLAAAQAAAMDRRDPLPRRRAKCALDIALHDLAGKVAGLPVHALLGLSADAPADRLHARHRRAGGRRRAGRPRGALPGAQDQVRRPGRPRDARGGPRRSTTGRSGSTPTPAGRPRTRESLLPALVDLGVELIEQPFPARALDDLAGSRSARRCRSSPTRAASSIEDLDALVGVVAGVNVKLAKCGGVGPARRDARARAGARLPDVPRLHGGDVGRDRGLGGRRVARRLGRPRRQPAPRRRPVRRASSSAPTTAGGSPTRRASGCTAARPTH